MDTGTSSGAAAGMANSALRLLTQWASVALHPFLYLLLYIVILYIRPQEYVPSLMETPLVPASLLTATVLWLVGQEKNFEASPHHLMIGLVAAIFMSVLMTGWLSGAIRTVIDFAPTMLLFYIVATSITSLRRFRVMCLVLTCVTAVIAYHGIDQFESEYGIGWTGAKMIQGRITYLGFLNDPNDLSMAFLMVLPLTLYLAHVWSWMPIRLALLATAGLIVYAIFLCNSRGSVLGLLSMLLFYATRRFGWFRGLVVGPTLMAPLLIFGPSRVGEISADEESAAGRIEAWYAGFEMFRSHPLFGVGKGLFTDHNRLTAHNSYVLAIAELGVLGYFVWLAMLILSVLMVVGVIRHRPRASRVADDRHASDEQRARSALTDPFRRSESPFADVQAAALALMYAFIGSMVAAFFLSRSYVVFVYLLLAMMIAIYQMARRQEPEMPAVRAGDMVGMLVLADVGSIGFLWLTTRVLLNFSS